MEDGQTQPQFDFAQAVEEALFVETDLDSDDDGRRDSGIALPLVGGERALGF